MQSAGCVTKAHFKRKQDQDGSSEIGLCICDGQQNDGLRYTYAFR